jgi:hypothetical protein
MGKQKDQVNDLLAAIKRQPITSSAQKTEAEIPEHIPDAKAAPIKRPSVKRATEAQPAPAQSRVGKPVQFWMHEPDRKLVRELSAWLAGQGVRPTDSMVIRAALRMAKTGSALLEAYWEAAKLDGRLKRD